MRMSATQVAISTFEPTRSLLRQLPLPRKIMFSPSPTYQRSSIPRDSPRLPIARHADARSRTRTMSAPQEKYQNEAVDVEAAQATPAADVSSTSLISPCHFFSRPFFAPQESRKLNLSFFIPMSFCTHEDLVRCFETFAPSCALPRSPPTRPQPTSLYNTLPHSITFAPQKMHEIFFCAPRLSGSFQHVSHLALVRHSSPPYTIGAFMSNNRALHLAPVTHHAQMHIKRRSINPCPH